MSRRPHALTAHRRSEPLADSDPDGVRLAPMAVLAVLPLAAAVALAYPVAAAVTLSALAGAAAQRGYDALSADGRTVDRVRADADSA